MSLLVHVTRPMVAGSRGRCDRGRASGWVGVMGGAERSIAHRRLIEFL